MSVILALMASGALAYLAIALLRFVERRQRDPLGEFLGKDTRRRATRMERVGEKAARFFPSLSLEDDLRWAQRGGHYIETTPGMVMAQALLLALGGGLLFLVTHSAMGLAAAGIAAAWPVVRLRGKADDVRKRTQRATPELALLLAAEMAAGTAPEAALRRAAELPGPLSRLVTEAVERSRTTGRPLLSSRGVSGTLLDVFGSCGVPALQVMALQLDLVAEKGVDGAQRMSEIARTLSFQYRQRLLEETEKLEDKLVAMIAVFYFVPMVVVMMGAFFSALQGAF